MEQKTEIVVFISSRDSTCSECGKDIGDHAWITLTREKGALCLSCADLDHLLFLQSGDAALTRRSKKHSTLWAVVLKWSRSRKRYERQGLLVEEKALELAENECLNDLDVRKRRNERAAIRQTEIDKEYVKSFAEKIHELYPGCPKSRANEIAQHACLKYSGRVGRSSSAKEFSKHAIKLAVAAHIRHTKTDYDLLLSKGSDRLGARHQINDKVLEVLSAWENPAEKK